MPTFVPCTLKMGQDGDPSEFFTKVTGFGYNDMISLPTLTKDAILDNLKRRFKVRRPFHVLALRAAVQLWLVFSPSFLAEESLSTSRSTLHSSLLASRLHRGRRFVASVSIALHALGRVSSSSPSCCALCLLLASSHGRIWLLTPHHLLCCSPLPRPSSLLVHALLARRRRWSTRTSETS